MFYDCNHNDVSFPWQAQCLHIPSEQHLAGPRLIDKSRMEPFKHWPCSTLFNTAGYGSLCCDIDYGSSQDWRDEARATFVIDSARFKLIEIPPTNQHIRHTH